MKTILALAEHPEFGESVRGALDASLYRVIDRTSVEEAEPLLANGLADACLLDLELGAAQGLWVIEKLRRRAPRLPILVYGGAKPWDWEEEAYLHGVSHILDKPVRARMLATLLERLWSESPPKPAGNSALTGSPAQPVRSSESSVSAATTESMHLLRDFSGILTHSLNTEGMLRQFLLLLRELMGINRAVVFLRQSTTDFGLTPGLSETRRLRAAGALGVSPALLEHVELSLESGLGGHIARLVRILRRTSDEVRNDAETQKEFDLLGGQVAVPLLDRETVLGVAVFDGRITGEPLTNAELELIFHLLEQVGLAVKNIHLHDQLAANHGMMADILREVGSGCLVVNRDLAIVHANKTARRFFARADRRGGELEFPDLPQAIGSKVYQVLKTGAAISNLRYEPAESPGTIYNLSIVPFHRHGEGAATSALLMAEDLTQAEQLRRLEVEAANLRLVKTMADRLTHEIGNAMVPLSTHQQLLADKWKDPEFRASLDLALADGVKRVTRLINQMRFLARDSLVSAQAFPLAPLIEEAYQEACKYQTAKSAQLRYEQAGKPIVVSGDRAALKHALTEVMLNALQANPADAKVGVRLNLDSNGSEAHSLSIEVQDNGGGFTSETAQKAVAPFFTTRNVGLGLGLTVSRKIVETHHGKLEIVPAKSGQAGLVRISLPMEPSVSMPM